MKKIKAIFKSKTFQTINLSLLILLIQGIGFGQTVGQNVVTELKPNQTIERELAGGQIDKYHIQAMANEFLQIKVEQKGIDVVVKLFDKDGKQLAEMDSPNGTKGFEYLIFVISEAGNYSVEVGSLEANAKKGNYAIFRETPRTATERDTELLQADSIFSEALILFDQGTEKQFRAAREKFLDTSRLYREIGNGSQEAESLYKVGLISHRLGEMQTALEYYKQALPLFQATANKVMESSTYMNIGFVYSTLGDNQKASEFHEKSMLTIKQRADGKDIRDEAGKLRDIGDRLYEAGEKHKALKYFIDALNIYRQNEDKRYESQMLIEIGRVYANLGDKQQASKYFEDGLNISHQLSKSKSGGFILAVTLGLIGEIYIDLGEKQQGLKYYLDALSIYRQSGYLDMVGHTAFGIGKVYADLGENQKALEYYNQSLLSYSRQTFKEIETKILNEIMITWESLQNFRVAIFYGKQSVNIYQEMRAHIKGLDEETQKTFLKSIEKTYRRLANILIAQGRIAEAEEVLAMLKEEEYLSYLRRDEKVAADLKARISLSPDEKKAFEDYEKFSSEITRTAEEFGVLEKKQKSLPLGESLSAEDQKQYDELKAKYDAAITVFNKFLDDLKVKFAQKGEQYKQVASVESDTQGLLKKLNQPRTVIISTIVGEDRLNLIVTTSDIQKAHTVDIKAAGLNKLVAEFREAVKNPSVDPRPLGKKLYDKLFPAALQKDLENIKADTIVWSLDGTLRYVPMAALWDGEKYLVERYTNAVLTLASRDKLDATANPDRQKWLAFGVGVSKQFENFNALPAVPQELCSVVDDPKKKEFCNKFGENGIFSGLMLSDEEFTLADFQNNLGKTPIVHIASHFSLNAGNETDSYLLLGGGKERRFSLDNLKKIRLDNIELLTLSACNTAMTSGANSSGVEIEGFGALAQKQGAKTVLATLWAVADDSTGELMTEFYRILETNSEIGKAQALRNAQMAMITGKLKSEETNEKRDVGVLKIGNKNGLPKFETDKEAPFAHPYYWSPFVLIGNWK